MSSNFIGSKISIITKSQCRYVGTIIGIDAQASSIILGNVKCYGTEHRGGNFVNNFMVGTVVPIMQFANSDIEDLKIDEDESVVEKPVPVQPPVAPPQRQPSIHDDPAIVQAVMSTTKKDLSTSNQLVNDLQQLNLSDEQQQQQQSRNVPKTEESRLHSNSGELNPSWPSSSSGNRSKFFDGSQSTNSDVSSINRSQSTWPTHPSSTSRQPLPSNDRSYPPQQQYQQLNNRQQNGYIQQRYNPNYQRRSAPSNQQQQQRRPGGGNRETFHDNGNNYDDDFDFETSNQKFDKIASEDEFKQQSESSNQFLPHHHHHQQQHSPLSHSEQTSEYEPIYDKKKSFFDHTSLEETSDVQGPMYNRTRNQDTFGYDRNQQQRYRGGAATGGYRRGNQHYRQQGNENYSYRQNNNNNNNGYQYRY